MSLHSHHKPVLPNCDDSPSKALWLENGWAGCRVATEELFDLSFDPNETHNVAGDAEHSAILAVMRESLDKWMHQTNDPPSTSISSCQLP